MTSEDLQQQHEAATEPKSDLEIAKDLNIEDLTPSKIDLIRRQALIKACELRGITHETLNISPSKFGKLNKTELAEALKGHYKKANADAKGQEKPAEDKKEAGAGFDIIEAIMELKEQILKARASGDYSKLDSSIADKMLLSASNDNSFENMNLSAGMFTKVIIGLGVIYFAARLIGFDTIANKINIVRKKAQKAQNKEAIKDEERS